MPKLPRTRRPIRLLRDAAGMNQREFALRLGISIDTLKSYEVGRLSVSDESAFKAMLVFGVDSSSVKLACGDPQDVFGDPYTPDSYQAWTIKRNTESMTRGLTKRLARSIAMLMRAAGERGRALPFFAECARALLQAEEEFNLRPISTAIAKENVVPERLRVSRKQLKTLAGQRPALGAILRDLPRPMPRKAMIEIELRSCQPPRVLLDTTFRAETSRGGRSAELLPAANAVEMLWRLSGTKEWRRRWGIEPRPAPARVLSNYPQKDVTYLR